MNDEHNESCPILAAAVRAVARCMRPAAGRRISEDIAAACRMLPKGRRAKADRFLRSSGRLIELRQLWARLDANAARVREAAGRVVQLAGNRPAADEEVAMAESSCHAAKLAGEAILPVWADVVNRLAAALGGTEMIPPELCEWPLVGD